MKKLILALTVLACGASASFAQTINNLGAGRGSVLGTDLFPSYQGANPAVRPTAAQIAAYVYSLTGGDATISGLGAVTFATVNANVGAFGSATQCVAHTVNAKGLITATSAVTCTPAIGSVTGTGTGVITALGINVGTAGSVVINGGALGTPSSGVATNLTGTAAGLTAGNVTTNANLTGAVTSVGNATSLGSFTSAQLLAALSTKTGTGSAVFGTAPTIDSLNATTAVTLAFITGSTQCLHVNTSGIISGTGSDCGPGAGAVSSVTGGTGVTVSPTTGAVVISTTVTQRNNTLTTDTLVAGDAGTVVTENNASSVAVGIAQAGTTGFASQQYWTVKNKGAGLVTITPTTSTIDGAATLTVKQNQSVDLYSDGTNYFTLPGRPLNVAASDLSGLGTGVATALGSALSSAGGVTSTIASGTAALGTSAIASATCATVVTAAATNTATTDVVLASFNGDPTAVTGYIPATAGMLTVIGYPTAGNVNFKVCNNTSASITPGAITLNWRVVR